MSEDADRYPDGPVVPFRWEELTALLDSLSDLPYGGEPVDQRAHALQSAFQAQRSGASDETTMAALLHDIGRAPSVRSQFPGAPHEVAGASWARPRLGPTVAWLIAAHVPAKRYLVATDPRYSALLSKVSVASLRVQGGPMSAEEIVEFSAQERSEDACLLRRWDEGAKSPGGAEADLDQLRESLLRVTERRRD